MTRVDAAEFRAGGTDVSERRRSGVARGEVIDLVATSAGITCHATSLVMSSYDPSANSPVAVNWIVPPTWTV